MTFLQNSMLWGLFAVSIPVIIHLLNRRRFRTVDWGAMQFLLKATRESRGKKRLKHILILVMRSLAIAGLVFAIARPLVGGFLGWGAGKVETVVLILDRSPSMERSEKDVQTTKRELVLERVKEAMAELGQARLVLIDSATGTAQEIESPDVLSELSLTAPTDSSADMPEMLNTAVDYLVEAKPNRAEVWVASDLQRGDWAPEDTRWDLFRANLTDLEMNVNLRVLASKSRERNDFSLRVVSTRRDADELILDLEVSREQDDAPIKKAITVTHKGVRTASEVSISGQTQQIQKRIPLEGNKTGGHGWVSIPDSANQRNNVAFFAYGAEAPVHAFLVVEQQTSNETLEALTKGLAPGFANQEVTVQQEKKAHLLDLEIASLVVWKAPLPGPSTSAQMLEFVQKGGVVMFLPPEADSENSFGGIAWEQLEEAPAKKNFIVEEWDHADGAFRDSAGGQELPMSRLKAIKRRALSGSVTPLATWIGEEKVPLLARRYVGDGQLLFLTTLPDYRWSNIEQTALHLVALQRSFEEGNKRLGAGFFGIAGTGSAKPQGQEIPTRIDSFPKNETISDAQEFEAGVYQFGERVVAVNRPREEDSMEIVTTADLDTILEGTSYSLLEEQGSADDSSTRPAWRAFLIAMLLFLIVEAILCLQPKRPAIGAAPTPTPS